MMPLLFRHKLVSFKKEITVVLGVIAVILILPAAAVASITDVSALVGGGSDGGSGDNATLYTGSSPANNTYTWGNCTYWVFIERQNANDPIPNTWGNADAWALYARLQGYRVDKTPAVGAIMQSSTDTIYGPGHVAYVTKVDPSSGAWTVSEMNVKGLDIIDTQTYPASAAANYNFI
ncbi:MAG TPA: CHAP domain-containing protein, partial [Patescibacteria group bacterium]|nr:CHAP domain-containing protein [Patescibacteria group bacterium]